MAIILASTAGADDKLYEISRIVVDSAAEQNLVKHPSWIAERNNLTPLESTRPRPWALPAQALAADYDTTIKCLVMRFNFQYESTDNPNTTSRGWMNLSRPLDTLSDEEYIAREGNLIDPPPHDSLYFDAHMRALARYWEHVSQGRIHLEWDIYPPYRDSVFQLPGPMNRYGKCAFAEVTGGLVTYSQDCFHVADSSYPEIDFSEYGAYFLFHAGADRQTDLGFPETCNDLFTGWIRFGYILGPGGELIDDAPYVDRTPTDSLRITSALLVPETMIQDNRVTAINAVMAHEFGHQLGLIDIYSTATFMSQVGDFALMDNNGFGMSYDFGWRNNVFGTLPIYPMAWSRAFLGFDEVVDFRGDSSDIRVVAAEVYQDTVGLDSAGSKIVRVPISEKEYYLIENRNRDIDGKRTYVWADSATSVIQGPTDSLKVFFGEYDDLIPGSGMLIFHIDEEVAELDWDGDGLNNFYDNQLQWWLPDEGRRFITLIEADGQIDFGGYYRKGYGSAQDMFRDDRNTSFTPNTNPATIDNSGNNTRIRITDITRDTAQGAAVTTFIDRWMLFDLEFDRKVDGFPVRVGEPYFGLLPIVDDLVETDTTREVIVASNRLLSVFTTTGEDFIRTISSCDTLTCPLYYDTSITFLDSAVSVVPSSVGPSYRVPVYAITPNPIFAGPVTGKFDTASTEKLVAVGYPHETVQGDGWVALYEPTDDNGDAQADYFVTPIRTSGIPIALSFGDILFALTSDGSVYRMSDQGSPPSSTTDTVCRVSNERYHGICRLGERLIVHAGDSVISGRATETRLYCVNTAQVASIVLDGYYLYGPIAVDVNRDGLPEVVLFTPEGDGLYVTVDTTSTPPSFRVLSERSTGHVVTTNPVAGDIDLDGYPDIVIGGPNLVYVYNADLILKTDFPLEADDRYPNSNVIAAPVLTDIERGGPVEVVFPTAVGNMYSFGAELSYGFPLSSGEQAENQSGTSAVVFSDETSANPTGKLGYSGGDG
ncbi:MAG: hypothetical protein DRP45_05675, partial [Candidatus Zixiibacteriota bacterium]